MEQIHPSHTQEVVASEVVDVTDKEKVIKKTIQIAKDNFQANYNNDISKTDNKVPCAFVGTLGHNTRGLLKNIVGFTYVPFTAKKGNYTKVLDNLVDIVWVYEQPKDPIQELKDRVATTIKECLVFLGYSNLDYELDLAVVDDKGMIKAWGLFKVESHSFYLPSLRERDNLKFRLVPHLIKYLLIMEQDNE